MGAYFEPPPPPLISETTGPILKIQVAFESPGKTVEGKKFIALGVTSDVTRQVKVKMFRHFGLGDIGEKNCDVKHKQNQLIGMDSVYTFISIIYCAL